MPLFFREQLHAFLGAKTVRFFPLTRTIPVIDSIWEVNKQQNRSVCCLFTPYARGQIQRALSVR
jgi:hypothetical protein